jgi:hypothetical protein
MRPALEQAGAVEERDASVLKLLVMTAEATVGEDRRDASVEEARSLAKEQPANATQSNASFTFSSRMVKNSDLHEI